MEISFLKAEIFRKKTLLCVGLDTDLSLIPRHLLEYSDPVFEFNKKIIENTHDLSVAYKINTAFYEAQGVHGWISLQKTVEYLKKNYPECFAIADAKRGDIGNTSAKYAKTFFELLPFDAVTVAPYMGYDSVEPFLAYKNKWTILLGITSNAGSKDFQILATEDGLLYEVVIKKAMRWAGPEKLMFVAGATQPDIIKQIRNLAKEYFLLIPGVGAQGGSVEEVCVNGINHFGGMFINSSRQIIYASQEHDFEQHVRYAAFSLQQKMQKFIR